MTQLTDEQVVREKWPDAVCIPDWLCGEEYGIYLQGPDYKRDADFGWHDTASRAWHDAAERIRKLKRDAARTNM